MKDCLWSLFTFLLLLTCCAPFFSPVVVEGKEVISVYTTNGSTVHVNQNFRHGQRIEVPLGKLTNDPTREGVIQINSLLNFNHHVSFGDGAGGDSGDNNGDESSTGNNNNGGRGRNAKKIGNGKYSKSGLGGPSTNEIEAPLPEYCSDKEQINRFAHVITHIPHDGCPSGIDGKLLEGINRRRACGRMAPLTLSVKLSAEATAEALRMLPNVKGWKPTRANVGHYWTSYWSNYASNINERYFNLLAYWDDNNRGRPFMRNLDRYFSAKEWAKVKEIGIGCAGRFARNGVYNRGTLLMALFEQPITPSDSHTPEDEHEDEDGDGVADPKRLPPYCAHEREKLREIHSNISVPVTACPADVLEQAIEGFVQQRVCAGLPRLIHTPEMATMATRWANNQSTNGLWYQPNMPIAGQYTIGKDAPQSKRVIDLRDLDIFSKWDEWKGVPWYVPGGSAKDRFFTAEEWARTREFGIGCATYPYAPSKTNLFWLVAYFKHPGKGELPGYCTDKSLKMSVSATVTVPQKGCPPEIQKAVVEGFQKRRICQGLPKMAHSEAAAAEATKWAADISIGDGYIRQYKPYGQFTSNSRVEWERSGSTIAIKDFDIFEKWATWKGRPWYTGAAAGDRYYSEKEWADTKEFGVGCASLTKRGKNYFFLVAFFKYPN